MRSRFRTALLVIAVPSIFASVAGAQINFNTTYPVGDTPVFAYAATDIGWVYDLPSAFTLTGINTIFGADVGADRDVTVEFFKDGPPYSGGTLLASAVFSSSIARGVLGGVTFTPLDLSPGNYFIGLLNIQGLSNITGDAGAIEVAVAADVGDGQFDAFKNVASPPTESPIFQLLGAPTLATPEPSSGLLVASALAILALGYGVRKKRSVTT